MRYSLSARNLAIRNLESRTRYFTDLINPDRCKEIIGLLRTDSGLPSAHLNQVISNSTLSLRIFQRFVIDYFRERQRPFSLWYCSSAPLNTHAMSELGLNRQAPLIALATEAKQLAVNHSSLKELDIAPAHTPQDIINFGQILAELQNNSHEATQFATFYQQLAALPEPKRSGLKLFLGKWQGQPVTCGSLFSSTGALGFYDLGTLAPLRGRGIGSALFQYLALEAQASGLHHVVALVAENRQQLYLDSGFYAVGEVDRYDFIPSQMA